NVAWSYGHQTEETIPELFPKPRVSLVGCLQDGFTPREGGPMRRREFLKASAAAGVASAFPSAFIGAAQAAAIPVKPLKAPATGQIPVAFVLSENAVLIDFAGPWEVFQDVDVPNRGSSMDDQMPFRLYTVAESTNPIRISGGLQIVPDYAFADAPPPKVIVIPAQRGGPKAVDWVRNAAKTADVTMSVCTGAFLLAD